MSYTTYATQDAVKEEVFCVLQPKKHIAATSFSLNSGSVYKTLFAYGPVVGLINKGDTYSLGTSTSLSAGQFYYDYSAQILYVRKYDSSAPLDTNDSSTDYFVVYFEIYVATTDSLWNARPTDSSTNVVQFHGIIKPDGCPKVNTSQSDTIFDYFPIQNTSLTIENDPNIFQDLIYDSSFHDATIRIYHCLGPQKTANFRQLAVCSMGNFVMSNDTITFDVLDIAYRLQKVITHGSGYDFFATTSHTSLDPAAEGKPIRSFYGYNRGIKPVNVTFVSTSPATSDNRDWAIGTLQRGTYGTVTSGIPSTYPDTSATYISQADYYKYSVGDKVTVDYQFHTDAFNINVSGKVFGNPSILQFGVGHISFQTTTGDFIGKTAVSNVKLVQGGVAYNLVANRDYTEQTFGQNTFGIRLNSSAESNAGASTINPLTDYLVLDVAGKGTLPQHSGTDFGTYEGNGCFENGIVVLYDFLKSYFGVIEADIDFTAFYNIWQTNITRVGFSIPDTASGSFPTFKDVVTKLLNTTLCKMYVTNTGIFSISPIGLTTSSVATVQTDDIVGESFKLVVSYDDLYQIDVKSQYIEAYLAFARSSSTDFRLYSDYYYNQSNKYITDAGSNAYMYLHGGHNQINLTTYHSDATQFTTYLNQLKAMLGERSAKIKLSTKNQLQTVNLNDTVTVTREKLPGFPYVPGTQNSRDYVVAEIEKTMTGVNLVLDDQKGITDNSTEFT